MKEASCNLDFALIAIRKKSDGSVHQIIRLKSESWHAPHASKASSLTRLAVKSFVRASTGISSFFWTVVFNSSWSTRPLLLLIQSWQDSKMLHRKQRAYKDHAEALACSKSILLFRIQCSQHLCLAMPQQASVHAPLAPFSCCSTFLEALCRSNTLPTSARDRAG